VDNFRILKKRTTKPRLHRLKLIYTLWEPTKLAELNGVAQLEGKSFEDGNKTAGRFKKSVNEIKTLTHEMRKEVSETNND
jgi:hypothetical protein